MTAITGSSLDQALGYARAGCTVAWIDDARGVDDAVYHAWLTLRDDSDVSVLRANGREKIKAEGGGIVRFFRSSNALRGYSVDVVFASCKYRDEKSMMSIMPSIAASEVGRFYALCERIEQVSG